MADLKTTLSLDTGSFDSGISSAIGSVLKLDKQARLASKGFLNFFDEKSTSLMRLAFAGVDLVLKKLETSIGGSSATMKRDLRSMTLAAQELEKTWRQLSAAEKQSAAGKELRTHIDDLIASAGNLKDTMGDVLNVIKFKASDTSLIDAIISGLTGISAVFQVASGAASLFGVSEEKLARVLKDLIAVMAITNGLKTIGNLLDKNSVLMNNLRIAKEKVLTAITIAKAAATRADTAATATNTAATVTRTVAITASTVATRIWNVVTAISKALFGDFSGLILVGAGALATYAIATSNSTEETKKQSKALEDAKKFLNDYNESVASTTGELVGKYAQLLLQWKNLKTTAEKNLWIKDNANEFLNLGLKVTDLKSAEDVFINNTNNMVAALEARARAMAAQNMLVKAYEEYYKKNMEADNTVAGGGYYHRVKVGDTYSADEGKAAGTWNSSRSGYSNLRVQTQEEADKINEKRLNDARERNRQAKEENTKALLKQTDYLNKEIVAGNEKAKALGLNTNATTTATNKSTGGRSGTSTGTTKKDPALVNSLKWYDEEISKLDTKIKLEPDPENAKVLVLQKKELEKQRDDFLIEIGLKSAPPDPNSLAGINKQIEDLLKEIQLSPDIDSDETRNNVLKLKSLISQRDAMTVKLTPKLYDEGSITDLENQIKEIDKRLSDENLDLKTRLELTENRQLLLNKIDTTTKGELTIKAIVEPTYIVKGSDFDKLQSYENAISKYDNIKHQYEIGIIGADEAIKQVEELNETLKKLGLKTIEIGNSFNGFVKQAETLKTITDAVQTLGSGFLQLGLSIGGAAGTAISAFGEIASTIASTIGQVIAMMIANGVSSAMDLPFPANLAAAAVVLAGLASIIATIKSAQGGSYADGGIVPGNSFHGDRLYARVNSGEMILNLRQQANLFRLLDGGNANGSGSGNVQFRIRGQELVGVLNNYNDKHNRLK